MPPSNPYLERMILLKCKLPYLMLLMCLIWIMPQVASAATDSTFTLTINNNHPVSGDGIQVTVLGQGLTDLYAYEIKLEFDSDHLTYDSWTAPASGFPVAPMINGNRLVFAYTKVGSISGSFGSLDLGTITFKTKGDGDAVVSLKSVKLVDSNLVSTVQTSDAQVFAAISAQGDNSKSATNVAAGITSISAPAQNAVSLVLPPVPSGFTVAIKRSDNTAVIRADGTIIPPATDTTVTLVLEVTKTSDHSKAITGNIQVVVPAKSAASYIPPVTLTSNSQDTKIVTVDDIRKPADNGKVNVSVSGDVNRVVLPANSGDLLGNNELSIHMDKLTLDLPPEVLRQLASQVSTEDLRDSTIQLNVIPVANAVAQYLLTKGQASSAAQLQLSGQVFDFSLSMIKKDGKVINLSNFDQPLTIHLKIDAGVDMSVTGIYYIDDDGKLAYIGGKYVNGEMVAQIYHFSKYAVLEYKKSFADLPSSHWAVASIKVLAAKQIINGTSATTFEPERSVTRAEFTAMLVRELNLTQEGSQTFDDVASDEWYAQPILIAAKAGIVTGKTTVSFAPNAQITREEMVTMIMRAYAINKGTLTVTATSFSDEMDIDSWALPYVREAASLQLINGREEGKFVPSGVSTRAEAATILMRILP